MRLHLAICLSFFLGLLASLFANSAATAQVIVVEETEELILDSPKSLPPGVKLAPPAGGGFAPAANPFGGPGAPTLPQPPKGGKPATPPKAADGKMPMPPKGDSKKGEEKPEEKKTTVTRPTEPPTPPNPNELKVKPDTNGMVHFQFHGQPWPAVLQWLADVSNLALDWQELPNDYLNLTTRRPYTIDQARDLINQRLVRRGYTILLEDEVLSVVKIEQINQATIPRVTPEQLADRMPNEFVKTKFRLEWLVAEEVVKEVETLKSKHGKYTPMNAANQIDAFDLVINLREVHAAIELLQSPERRKQLAREFVLDHTRAEEVANDLREFLGVSGGAKGPAQAMNPQQMAKMQQALMQQMQAAARSGKKPPTAATPRNTEMRVVANTRRNSIVVHAPPDKIAIVEEFIDLVDVPSEAPGSLNAFNTRMQVFRLVSIDPQRLLDSLSALGSLEPRTKLTVDSENNALIVYGSLADQVLIKSVIDRLDGSGRQSEVIQLRRLPADQVAASIMFLMGADEKKTQPRSDWGWGGWSRSRENSQRDKFRVTANVEYNQLLVWANEIELAEVENLLKKLGEIPPSGARQGMRVINAGSPAQMREFLGRLKSAWPEDAELILPDEADLPPIPKAQESETGSADEPAEKSNDRARDSAKGLGKEPGKNATTRLKSAPNLLVSATLDGESEQSRASGNTPAPEPTSPSDDAENEALRERLELLKRLRNERPAVAPPTTDPASPKRPRVKVTVNSNGELIFSSDDPEALLFAERLAEQFAPPRKAYEIFKLKHADAYWVRFNLEDYFEEEEEPDNGWMAMMFGFPPSSKEKTPLQLGTRKPPRFIDDLDTNTILVRGADAEQLRIVGELIKLYDVPEPVDEEEVRHTKVFYIKYSRPSLVEKTLKEALRDLLSSNDKAFQQQQQRQNDRNNGQGPPPRSFTTKGKLSIGSDDVSRVMIVTCEGATLMEIVSKMIETLDKAAQPAEAMEVIGVGPSVSVRSIQQALGSFGAQPPAAQPKPKSNNSEPKSKGQSNGNGGSPKSAPIKADFGSPEQALIIGGPSPFGP